MKRSSRYSFRRSSQNDSGKIIFVLIVLLAVLALLFFVALFIGAAWVSAEDVLHWIFGFEVNGKASQILGVLRFPRAFAAVTCGATLALSGLALQTSLNNALASPGIIGVNAGAGFLLVISAVLFPFSLIMREVAILVGAVLSALFTVTIARRAGATHHTIILAGVAVSAFCSAGSDAVITMEPGAVYDRIAFYIGSFSMVRETAVFSGLPYMIVGTLGIFLSSRRLELLILGDEVAESLGVNTNAVRLYTTLFAACLAAGAVSICGLLGFVGLVVPHICRRMFGGIRSFALMALATMLIGSVLTLTCDILARTLFAPYELPVGVFLSFIGVPFFLHLLISRKRRIVE